MQAFVFANKSKKQENRFAQAPFLFQGFNIQIWIGFEDIVNGMIEF